jgi:hypothetical protein
MELPKNSLWFNLRIRTQLQILDTNPKIKTLVERWKFGEAFFQLVTNKYQTLALLQY